MTLHAGSAREKLTTLHGPRLIDCDLHNELPDLETLYPYLPDYWCDYLDQSAFTGPDANDYPTNAPTTMRPDLRTNGAELAGTTLEDMRTNALDPWAVDVGILNCSYRVQNVHNSDLGAALATAINRWQIDHWLEPEPRLRASIVVPNQNIELAAQEIDRFGPHPSFVQAVMPVRSLLPYGNRHYDPIFAAAVHHDLVVGIQYGGSPGHAPTPSGWLSTFLEEYAAMAQVFQSQLTSLIIEGVFDRFPTLRVTFIESGFTWLPSWMWRMDKEWKGLRDNTPWVKRSPSDYVREHVRFTTQPLDAPPTSEQMAEILAQMESDELLLFATDYPHWHFDDPTDAWTLALPDESAQKIMADNAADWYRL